MTQVLVDPRVPFDTIYFLDEKYAPMLAFDRLHWAMHPDPLIHSWRWLQKDKPIVHVWVEDSLTLERR